MNPKSLDFPVAKLSGRKGIRFFAPYLLCVAAIGAPNDIARAQSADEILKGVRASENKVQLRATQVVQRGASREVATLYRSGIKRRLEWSAPGVRAGDVLVDDGQTVTLFHRADNTAIQTQSAHRAPVVLSGDWKVSAPIQQNGRTVRVLSRDKGREMTIDAKTNAILRVKNGGEVTNLQNVDYGAVAPAKFQFSAPAGVQILKTEGRLFGDLGAARGFASWLQAPADLPAGYALESAIAGKDEVWLRYSNGKKRFSLFQQKTSDSDLALQKVNGAWFWRKNGLRFVATGAPENAVAAMAK